MYEPPLMRFFLRRLPAALLVAWVCTPLQAQVQIPFSADPGVIQNRELEREQRLRSEDERRERIEQPVQPVAPPATPAADNSAVVFQVKDIRFEPGSEILTAQELESLAAGLRGRTVRLSDLNELVERINALYKAKGVVTSQASLPPQDITDGTIRIRLIEGRVGNIKLDGLAFTQNTFINDRLTLQPGALVDLPVLERDLLRFNRSNAAQLRADLKPGATLGHTDIGITVIEPKRDDLRLFSDNTGSSATGVERFGLTYTRRSLTGRSDDFYVSVVRTEGNLGTALTYSLPVSRLGTRVTLGYFKDDTQIVAGPIAALDITGQAKSWSVSVRHPLKVSANLHIDGLATWKQLDTVNWIGATELTSASLAGGTIGLDAQLLDAKGFWTVTAELGMGKNTPEGADARNYTVARGAVRRNYSIDPQWTLNGSFNWQYADLTLLPSSEQIQLGGEGSVRGFEPGVFAGDQGWVANLELQRRLPLSGDSGWAAAMLVFVDHGQVQPYRPPNNLVGADSLTSVGAGVTVAWRDRVQARFTVGKPLNPPPEDTAGTRMHFQLIWSLS